jgi:RimJ/RimL family protein N-acetyltransferase
MPGPLFTAGETVELRPIEEEDVPFLQELVNDPQVREGLGTYEPINEAAEQEWFESISEDDDVHLLICTDDDPVGSIGLHMKHDAWGNAEVGYSLVPSAWGNGYATDALQEVCRWAFEERRLNKITARAYETNPASNRVLQKVGFEQEGTFRDEAYVKGQFVDIYRYGLLADEFER